LQVYTGSAYLFFCKLWPFVFYPNYLFKSKIEDYQELRELASKLKLEDRSKTARNVYEYMQDTYTGSKEVLRPQNL